jgi:hypothetical protein
VLASKAKHAASNGATTVQLQSQIWPQQATKDFMVLTFGSKKIQLQELDLFCSNAVGKFRLGITTAGILRPVLTAKQQLFHHILVRLFVAILFREVNLCL